MPLKPINQSMRYLIITIIIIIVGEVIHREMWKKFRFEHANKWCMHNLALVQENDTHKLLWDFDIETDHLISARRPDLIIINKKRKSAKLSTLLSRSTIE